ncbi:MAG: MFS transporter [Actinobacteria bacterium]|nr:MFS transporter [Actinomycetota bacterium]
MSLKNNSRLQISLAMSGHAITDFYASFIIGLIPILAIKFNLSLFLVGLLTSVTGISNSLTQPAFGYLADKYNPKYFLIAGPLFSAILISFMPVMPNYYLVVIILFLGNLSISAMHPPTAAMGGQFGGRMKGLSNSLISFFGTVGYALGSLFIIFIIEKLGISFAPITMIPGIVMAIILFRYVDIPFKPTGTKSSYIFFTKLKKANKYKILQLFFIFTASFARDITWILMITFMPLYFTNSGIKLLNVGYILILYNIIGGFGGIIAGYFSERVKSKSYLIQGGLLLSLPFIFFMFKTTGIIPVIFFIIIGFFTIATLPLCIRISQDIFPGSMSLASSMVMGFSVGIGSIVMIFLGRVADKIGIVNTVYYSSISIVAIIILLSFYPLIAKKAASQNT